MKYTIRSNKGFLRRPDTGKEERGTLHKLRKRSSSSRFRLRKRSVRRLYGSFIFPLLFCPACNAYLDHVPDNRARLEDREAVAELLVSAYPDISYVPFCEIMSDNADDKGKVMGQGEDFHIECYEWKVPRSVSQDTPTAYWNSCYRAIAAANQALESIKTMGREKEPEYLPLIGEALVCRAYAHYMLASLFAMPYNPETAGKLPGIPIATRPEKVIFAEYERGTLEQTYKCIREDLETGIKLLENGYDVPKYHFTKEAAAAFAARFYQTLGEWDKVIEAADRAIGHTDAKIRAWNNPQTYGRYSYAEIAAAYSSSGEPANLLLASCLSAWPRKFAVNRFGLSQEILPQLFFNRKNVLGADIAVGLYGNEKVLNIPKVKEYFKQEGLNATSGWIYVMLPLFTAEEALFNRAEAYAMKGDYSACIGDINLYFGRRIRGYSGSEAETLTEEKVKRYYAGRKPHLHTWYAVDAATEPYLKCIADLRRSEFVHEGMRWFDVRRWGLDIVHIRRTGENDHPLTLHLKHDDPRRALQLPEDAVANGLEPNPRK